MTYTATEFDTAADKEKFELQFKRFVMSDFAENKFPNWFYKSLSMTFGHIAHYNKAGFYSTFYYNGRYVQRSSTSSTSFTRLLNGHATGRQHSLIATLSAL